MTDLNCTATGARNGVAAAFGEPDMSETAAIAINGRVFSLPRPKRHHDIINYLAEIERLPTPIGGEQGFVDSELGFVDRNAAGRIAIDAGQIEKLKWPPQLFSEDLW